MHIMDFMWINQVHPAAKSRHSNDRVRTSKYTNNKPGQGANHHQNSTVWYPLSPLCTPPMSDDIRSSNHRNTNNAHTRNTLTVKIIAKSMILKPSPPPQAKLSWREILSAAAAAADGGTFHYFTNTSDPLRSSSECELLNVWQLSTTSTPTWKFRLLAVES